MNEIVTRIDRDTVGVFFLFVRIFVCRMYCTSHNLSFCKVPGKAYNMIVDGSRTDLCVQRDFIGNLITFRDDVFNDMHAEWTWRKL